MKVTELLSRDEIKDLNTPSDLHGWLAVATTWGLITGSLALAVWWTNPLSILIAVVLIGGRHLALAILMHDSAHYSLFRTRWLNDVVGAWLCANPTWQHLPRYREHHLRHHKWAGSPQDPDLDLVTAYPTTKASLRRKLTRDLVGLTAIKRVYGQILMDLGYIEYTVSSKVVKIDQTGRTLGDILRTGARNLHGVVLTNLLFFGALYLLGKPWLYLIWVAAYTTTFSAFIRIRSIAEHACTREGLDPFNNTRSTEANLLARVTVAPHYVNYHLEHHLLMTVPNFNLPRMHRMLAGRGALKDAFVAPGYLAVLRTAASRS